MSEDTVFDWKEDLGEGATRIWKWCKARRDKFKFHAFVLLLIVLALSQLSSCNIGRLSPQLELIRQRCDENMMGVLAKE